MRHMSQMNKKDDDDNKENFQTDRLSTYYGPYDGQAYCAGIGARTINKNQTIGDDSGIFN